MELGGHLAGMIVVVEDPHTSTLLYVVRNSQEKTCAAQRQRMTLQNSPAMVLPLVIHNIKETTDLAQRRNIAVQDPEMSRMPPSTHTT